MKFLKKAVPAFFILLLLFAGQVITADEWVRNPVDWLDELETFVYGQPGSGSLMERLDRFEAGFIGKNRDGSLVERLKYLDKVVFENQPHDISLLYKIQALEWVIYRRMHTGSLLSRTEQVETVLFGSASSGSLTKRLERLINQTFPGGSVRARWTSIPEGVLVKVRLLDSLNSKKNKAGDSFRFEVIETSSYQNAIIFPEGTLGTGRLQQVKRPDTLGRDAMLVLDFGAVRTLDGTPVGLFYGAKASELNSSLQKAVGASTAGMLAFGPGGILFGLIIKGQEKTIKEGTDFYVQVNEGFRIYTLAEDRG